MDNDKLFNDDLADSTRHNIPHDRGQNDEINTVSPSTQEEIEQIKRQYNFNPLENKNDALLEVDSTVENSRVVHEAEANAEKVNETAEKTENNGLYAPKKCDVSASNEVNENKNTSKPTKSTPWLKMTALVGVSLIIGGTVGGIIVGELYSHKFSSSPTFAVNSNEKGNEAETITQTLSGGVDLTPSQIATKTAPAVVAINITEKIRHVFGEVGTAQAYGSGVLISSDGYIVTNNHVINGASSIEVNLSNGKSYSAKVIGRDPVTDLAVIKIDEKNLPYLKMADSSRVKMGDRVVAIGNPLGDLQGSLTVGYISATGRTLTVQDENGGVTTMYGLLQTDAAINRGNSGGALINTRGDLIGINSAKNAAVGVEGLGFAIPTNVVSNVVNDLIKFGHVQSRPWIGIEGSSVSRELQHFGFPVGIVIVKVVPNSPADKAKLKVDDIITQVDGKNVAMNSDIIGILAQHKVGDVLKLSVQRGKERLAIDLTLGAKNEES